MPARCGGRTPRAWHADASATIAFRAAGLALIGRNTLSPEDIGVTRPLFVRCAGEETLGWSARRYDSRLSEGEVRADAPCICSNRPCWWGYVEGSADLKGTTAEGGLCIVLFLF